MDNDAMDQGRFQELKTLVGEALELAIAERDEFVVRRCGEDSELLAEARSLLAQESSIGADGLTIDVAARVGREATLVSEAAAVQPESIGPYRILQRIGEGGMGEVFVAEQSDPLRRQVAVKVIKLGMDTRQVIARFEAERQALALMNHRCIANVYDAGATPAGRPYIVMEYVKGVPINIYCDRHKLNLRKRLELFSLVCDGVQHAHQKAVIHRDLKPGNILVTEEDGLAVPKIIDFGVAKATGQQLTDLTMFTQIGQMIGTLEYMSPEQADLTGEGIDTRTDVYSLGVILYELLVGTLPFDPVLLRESGYDEMRRIISEQDPPAPSTRLKVLDDKVRGILIARNTDHTRWIRTMSGDLDWIVLKALEKDRNRRYASPLGLAADVRRHLAHDPVLAARPSILYRAGKFVRRNRVAVVAVALIAAATLVGVSGIVSGRLESMAAVQVAQAQKPYADAYALSNLVQRADEKLWPPYPEKIHDLELWIEDAEELVLTLASHRGELLAMEADDRQRESAEYQSRQETLAGLVAGLLALNDDTTGLMGANPEAVSPDHGWSVPRRLAFARQLEVGFSDGGQYTAAWHRSLPKIRAAYSGLELPPEARMGLVPIGEDPDPESGLWEFANLMTGEPAVRGGDGKLVLTEQTGIVLVLIPGGTFSMGDPETKWTKHNLHEVELSPYWLSKYEMTQGQWQRLTGRNPSSYGPGLKWDRQWLASGDEASLLHPVEQVSWWDCEVWLPRCGLSLPSEAQWEYGARSHNQSWFWCGNGPTSLQGNANVSDAYARDHGGVGHDKPGRIDDGATMHTPVDSYAANGFGLHNVIGNVLEWCLDGYDPDFYHGEHGPNPLAPGIGEYPRVYRGGSFRHLPMSARSAQRYHYPPGMKGLALGVRPALSILQP
jgi:serine/threonine protein kinase/formylglycine-generating enzyme required for sulfatase activity